MRKKSSRVVFIVLVLFLSLLIIQKRNIGSSAEATTKVFVDPPETIDPGKGIGSTFTVRVNVSNVEELYGWQVNMTYNPAVLNTTLASIVEGPFLKKNGDPTQIITKKVNNALGTLLVAYMLRLPYPPNGVSGNGTLVSITFKVKALERATLLRLVTDGLFPTKLNTIIADNPVPIEHTTEDGVFDNRTPPTNTPPTADFSANPPIVSVSKAISFDASASYDSDAWLVSYYWDFGDGATQLLLREYLSNVNLTAKATHSYGEIGTYTVSLTVTDNDGATDSVTADVIVKAHDIVDYPVVIGGFTFHIIIETNSNTANFQFNQLEKKINFTTQGGIETDGVCNVTIPVDLLGGPYTVWLDALNITQNVQETTNSTHTFLYFTYIQNTHNIEITGHTVATPPVASFTSSTTRAQSGTIITFNASDSYDPDENYPLTYSWDFGDGTESIGQTAEHAYASYGNYDATLTVKDAKQLTSSAKTTITITEKPQAAFTYSPSIPFVSQPVTFNASSSNPKGGEIISYEWDFGDGTTATSVTSIHTYNDPGNYTVVLNVTDNEELWDTETMIVPVIKTSSELALEATPATLTLGEEVTISGTITPTRTGMSITIQHRLIDAPSWTTIGTTTTDSEGHYTYNWKPEEAGTYEIKANWPGDTSTLPAESDPQQITVKEPPAQINMLYIAGAAIAIILIAVAVYFLKIRKP